MTVTKTEPVTKNRFRVYIDGEFAFVLYKGELSRYHIAENEELGGETYTEILSNIVSKRAKARALHLLNAMGRTEAQLRARLEQDGYRDCIAEEAIAYVKSFGYLDDKEYARSFIECRKDRKSRRELYMALCQKGIAREEAEQALDEFYGGDASKKAIEAIFRKKKFIPETADYIQKQKMGGYLMRKGFRYEEIKQVLDEA